MIRKIEILKIDNSKVLQVLGKLMGRGKNARRRFVIHKELRQKLKNILNEMKILVAQVGSCPLKIRMGKGRGIVSVEKTDIMLFLDDLSSMKAKKAEIMLENDNWVKGILLKNLKSDTSYFIHGNCDLDKRFNLVKNMLRSVQMEIRLSVQFSIPEEDEEEFDIKKIGQARDNVTEKKTLNCNKVQRKGEDREVSSFSPGCDKSLQLELVKLEEKQRLVLEENKSLKRKIQRFNSENEILIKENEQLKHDNTIYSVEIESVRNSVKKYQSRIEILKEKIEVQSSNITQEIQSRMSNSEKQYMQRFMYLRNEKLEFEEQNKKLRERVEDYRRRLGVIEESKQRMIKLMNVKDDQFYKISLELKEQSSELEGLRRLKLSLGNELKAQKIKNLKLNENLSVSTLEIKSLKSERIKQKSKNKVQKNLNKDFSKMEILKSFINYRDQKLNEELNKPPTLCKHCKLHSTPNDSRNNSRDSNENVILEPSTRPKFSNCSTKKKILRENLQLHKILEILDKILSCMFKKKGDLTTLRSLRKSQIDAASSTTRDLIALCLNKAVDVYKHVKLTWQKQVEIQERESVSEMTIKMLQQKINFNRILNQRKNKKKNAELEWEINHGGRDNKENVMDYGNFRY